MSRSRRALRSRSHRRSKPEPRSRSRRSRFRKRTPTRKSPVRRSRSRRSLSRKKSLFKKRTLTDKSPVRRSRSIKRSYSRQRNPTRCYAGCRLLYTKKYQSRPGPPRAANEPACHYAKFLGNDGHRYQSLPNKHGIFRWVKM